MHLYCVLLKRDDLFLSLTALYVQVLNDRSVSVWKHIEDRLQTSQIINESLTLDWVLVYFVMEADY